MESESKLESVNLADSDSGPESQVNTPQQTTILDMQPLENIERGKEKKSDSVKIKANKASFVYRILSDRGIGDNFEAIAIVLRPLQ